MSQTFRYFFFNSIKLELKTPATLINIYHVETLYLMHTLTMVHSFTNPTSDMFGEKNTLESMGGRVEA
jgi:hypothetical protein